MKDLWVETNLPVIIFTRTDQCLGFTGVTFSIFLSTRMEDRPFRKAMEPSNRISNRYTFFLVAI